jgi:cell division protein FtsL
MKDWSEGIETRNYGIKDGANTGVLFEFLRTMTMISLIAGASLFFSWVRSQIINTGYESQKLFTQEESLLRIQKKLILEEETLRNPERIDMIARTELNMAPLLPNQMIMTSLRNEAAGNVMAMANPEAANARTISEVNASEVNRRN